MIVAQHYFFAGNVIKVKCGPIFGFKNTNFSVWNYFRSDTALGNDIIGNDIIAGSQQKLFIPLSALSRIENVKILKGHFTKLWKGRWISKDGKLDVAIKQLKHNDSHLLPFMTMSAYAMLWNDSTLIKIHGATLGLFLKFSIL